MLRFLSVIGWLSVAVSGMGQTLAKMSDPIGIDVRVEDVNWHPRGTALIYMRDEDRGRSLGVFAPGASEGTVLLPLQPADQFSISWLPGQLSAIVVVTRPIPGPPAENEISIYLLDAKSAKRSDLFLQRYPAADTPSVEVEGSPLLVHAILTFRDSKGETHRVLPPNRVRLINAPDIDVAVAQGLTGPTWTIDGTATYSDTASAQLHLKFSSIVSRVQSADQSANGPSTDDQQVSLEVALRVLEDRKKANLNRTVSDDVALSIMALSKTVIPTPDLGASVRELIPMQGILRPVRFRGAFTYPDVPTPQLETFSTTASVQESGVAAQVPNAWLRAKGAQNVAPRHIGADVQQTWLAPENRMVAYVVHGALFVRMPSK